MPWEPLDNEEREFLNRLQRARGLGESGSTKLLNASAVLAVVEAAFGYDRCKELSTLVVEYARKNIYKDSEQGPRRRR